MHICIKFPGNPLSKCGIFQYLYQIQCTSSSSCDILVAMKSKHFWSCRQRSHLLSDSSTAARLTSARSSQPGVQRGLTLHSGRGQDTRARSNPVLTPLRQYTHTVLITVASCQQHTQVRWQLLSGVQLVLSWRPLLTNVSLVVQVKLSIFICKANTHGRWLLTLVFTLIIFLSDTHTHTQLL